MLWGLEFLVSGLGFGVSLWGLIAHALSAYSPIVCGLWFSSWGVGFKVRASGFRVQI